MLIRAHGNHAGVDSLIVTLLCCQTTVIAHSQSEANAARVRTYSLEAEARLRGRGSGEVGGLGSRLRWERIWIGGRDGRVSSTCRLICLYSVLRMELASKICHCLGKGRRDDMFYRGGVTSMTTEGVLLTT